MGLALHLCHLLGLALSPGRVGKESCLFCEGETAMILRVVDGLIVSRDTGVGKGIGGSESQVSAGG